VPRYDTITFLTDYGTDDEFVGVVKSVIRQIAPHAAVVDLCHDVAPYDVRAGGLMLARAAQYLCSGVVLAVVDPGVGSDRRAIAVEVGGGDSVLVGPDNGLLAPAVAMVGGASRVVELTNPTYQLPAPGATFAGRDVFGPAAAHLCAGVPLTDLGPLVEAGTLRPALLSLSREERGGIEGEVLWVDRFGNLQLNVDPDELVGLGDAIALCLGERRRLLRRVSSFAELRTGELGLVIDSYGLLAVVSDRASAALELRLGAGDAVRLEPAGDEGDGNGGGVTMPVSLRQGPMSLRRGPGGPGAGR
jgi:S-adenosylmethionine hydrolase